MTQCGKNVARTSGGNATAAGTGSVCATLTTLRFLLCPALRPTAQVERPVTATSACDGGDINIWTGRRIGPRGGGGGASSGGGGRSGGGGSGGRAKSHYRCRPETDTGRTRGSDGRVSVFCSYFARGMCAEGPMCRYLHRLPTAADAAAHARNNSQARRA